MSNDHPLYLREQACKCRRLAAACADAIAAEALGNLALDYDARALAADPVEQPPAR
jgi:hypothetical protein